MLLISKRGEQMPPSPIRKLVPFAEAAKKKGYKVYHLNIGQPDIETPPAILDAVRHTDIKVLEYSLVPVMKATAATCAVIRLASMEL
jgi:aspartate aminotransferase